MRNIRQYTSKGFLLAMPVRAGPRVVTSRWVTSYKLPSTVMFNWFRTGMHDFADRDAAVRCEIEPPRAAGFLTYSTL